MFLIMSDTDATFNFLISMIYTQLFNLLCEKADDVYGGRLPVHVRCLIDEAANIGQNEWMILFCRQFLILPIKISYMVNVLILHNGSIEHTAGRINFQTVIKNINMHFAADLHIITMNQCIHKGFVDSLLNCF